MSIKKSVFSKLIKNFQLRELFNQLGWNHTTKKEPVAVDSQVYQLEAIAEKSAFFVFVCETSGKVPDYATRKKIDSAITKLYHQHLIIYTDSGNRQQVWQLVVKELDKPAVVRETPYFSTQEPELLFQKLQHLFFSIDEEDNITIADVTGRIGGAFNTNAEKVTKKFYEGFKKEHTAFLSFIKGISESQDKDWYASLMLNRLMFIYFIQKKGFLNNDKFYLKTKLAETQSRKGKDNFYSFYRNFLLVLFHQGLGSPDNKKLESELGKVPYLNGGLFDVHELETTYSAIQIEDKAFERIFRFFDEYEWHLDTRQQATGKEINPDVIGYIFEKYINDRAAMGAYYTREDITDYIGKNCIIPFLFDELKRHYPVALNKGSDVWKLLQQHPGDYIYPAIQHGVEIELPAEIAKGLDNVSQRGGWNKPAPSEYALPTEIWREVVDRRRRYAEVKEKIEAGDIHEINDLITYNLNITKFAIDVIQNSTDAELIRHFYKALEKITVLDPTCGSGAFLFAAMNILEPLYEACIGRMRAFVDESQPQPPSIPPSQGGSFEASPEKGRFGGVSFFRQTLSRVDAPEHPNLQYFIFKTIILNNLFGVDIMKEAIEIAKLRLFLKLVATVDVDYKKPNMGLEPLPDIDFNIRSGNTLVGFVSIDEVKKAVEGQLGFYDKDITNIEEAAEYVKRAYDSFREVQIAGDATVKEFKKILTEKLAKLNDRLDVYLAKLYGKDPKKATEFKAWHNSHKPFHWFADFYEIIHDRGGFDVIIGNPPYVEYTKVVSCYKIHSFKTESCGNLYAFVVERSYALTRDKGKIGLIVPISISAAQRMAVLQKLITSNSCYLAIATFGLRPAALFPGVMQRLTIFVASKGMEANIFTTDYVTWYAEERNHLFNSLSYFPLGKLQQTYSIPKANNLCAHSALTKILSKTRPWAHHNQFKGQHIIYYHNAGGYWIKTFNFKPYYKSLKTIDKKHTTISDLRMPTAALADLYLGVLSSSLFYFFWKSLTDARHVYPSDIAMFPIDLSAMSKASDAIHKAGEELMNALNKNRKRITYGDAEVDQFNVSPTKPIIDKIDTLLAKHYGFTNEELDFIINYDIKYRMGKGSGDDEDSE